MISTAGKLKHRDEMIAGLWKWLPWLSFFLVTIPAPLTFLVLFLTSSATDTAAFYLVLVVLSLGISGLLGLVALIFLILYRRRWFRKLRNRLAEDGITADEVHWFTSELTSAERQALKEIQKQNPLLADAYCETLASRLTATRIITRANAERIKVERRMNRARSLIGADTASLLSELQSDHQQLEGLRAEATSRLAEAKARLQTIEAAASRALNQKETDLMLRRLAESQSHLPLAIEMAKLEQQMMREAENELDVHQPDENTMAPKTS
jgi:hypothetical protein